MQCTPHYASNIITNIFLIFINFIFFLTLRPRIGRRSSHDDPGLVFHVIDTDRFDLCILFDARIHLFHNDIACIHSLIYDKVFDCRKGNFFYFCKQCIVTPHDGHISGNSVFLIIKRIHNSECDHIVESHTGSQLRMLF